MPSDAAQFLITEGDITRFCIYRRWHGSPRDVQIHLRKVLRRWGGLTSIHHAGGFAAQLIGGGSARGAGSFMLIDPAGCEGTERDYDYIIEVRGIGRPARLTIYDRRDTSGKRIVFCGDLAVFVSRVVAGLPGRLLPRIRRNPPDLAARRIKRRLARGAQRLDELISRGEVVDSLARGADLTGVHDVSDRYKDRARARRTGANRDEPGDDAE